MSTLRGRPPHGAVRYLSKEQQMVLRAQAVDHMHEMLKEAPRTSAEMQRATGIQKDTLNGYLRYMHKTLRSVRPTSETRGQSTLWAFGADPAVPTQDEKIDRLFAAKRGTTKAVQIGMPRDPLVAALFGPATR